MSQSVTLQLVTLTLTVNAISVYQRELSDFDLQMRTDLVRAFFPETDFFCENVTYIHTKPYSGTEIYSGYFEDPTREGMLQAREQIVMSKSRVKSNILHPTLELNAFAMEQFPHLDDRVIIRGSRYQIDYLSNDGMGIVKLFLVRSST